MQGDTKRGRNEATAKPSPIMLLGSLAAARYVGSALVAFWAG